MDDFDALLRRQDEQINRVGWAVTMVMPTVDEPGTPFAYTVGLTAHGSPELVIAGLPPDITHALLNDLAHRVLDSTARFSHGQRIADLLSGYDAVIVDGPATEPLYPGTAYKRYGTDRVRLQQVVWPDPQDRYPWDAGYAHDRTSSPSSGNPSREEHRDGPSGVGSTRPPRGDPAGRHRPSAHRRRSAPPLRGRRRAGAHQRRR
jgi:hypothetical protein